jgi:gluconokinase
MTGTDQLPQRVWSLALAHTVTGPVIVVMMGVSGSGKSTIAALLAAALGCQFQEGDDLHPPRMWKRCGAGLH